MDDRDQKDYCFVKETTKKKPADHRRLIRRMMVIIIAAAAFGAAACLVFCLFQPVLKKEISGTGANGYADTATGENRVKEEDDDDHLTLDDYEDLENQLYAVGKNAEGAVVTIEGVTVMHSLFDSVYEPGNHGSGVIFRETEEAFLILTDRSQAQEASAVHISFSDGESVSAQVQGTDGTTGLTVLKVLKEDLSEEIKKKIRVLPISDGLELKPGSFLIAVGSPQGTSGSVLTGQITSMDTLASMSDMNYRIITTDMDISPDANGVVLDTDGKMVGVIVHTDQEEGRMEVLPAGEISDLLKDLSVGQEMPYLGVHISYITDETAEKYSLPQGLYITDVEMDSPAMKAGIQTGDILTEIGTRTVTGEQSLKQFLQKSMTGQSVRLCVMRLGKDQNYQPVICSAILERHP